MAPKATDSPETIEEKIPGIVQDSTFVAAFHGFMSECEMHDLRIDNITFKDIKDGQVRDVGSLFGIDLKAREVIR